MTSGILKTGILVAGQVIHLQREADGQLRKLFLRAADFGDVFVQLRKIHAPVVEIILTHRRVVGESDFRQAERDGAARVIHRLAGRVAAERRVHMIIGGQLHG